MAYSNKPRTAAQLTGTARGAAETAATGYGLAAYLPDQDNYGLTFDFDVNQVDVVDPASFRAWNTVSEFDREGGTESRSGKLPPMSRSHFVDEYTKLNLYNQPELLGAAEEKYAARLGASFAARIELARGEAIETGKVNIEDRGLALNVDYGRKATHDITVGTSWTAAGATPIDDLDAADQVYSDTNGTSVGIILFSKRVFRGLQTNEDMIRMSVGRGSDLPSRISDADVRSVLSDYGYTNIRIFDELIGTKRVIGERSVMFLPASTAGTGLEGGSLGTTDWGIPAEATNPTYGISDAEKPGIFAGAFTSEDPEGIKVLASAIALPVLTNANATLRLAV